MRSRNGPFQRGNCTPYRPDRACALVQRATDHHHRRADKEKPDSQRAIDDGNSAERGEACADDERSPRNPWPNTRPDLLRARDMILDGHQHSCPAEGAAQDGEIPIVIPAAVNVPHAIGAQGILEKPGT